MLLFRGIGRKLSVPILVLSFLGWLLYVIGFAAFNNRDNYYNAFRDNNQTVGFSGNRIYFLREDNTLPGQRADLFWFPHWCVLIVGPFLYLCSVLHLIVGRFFTGIFTKFLTALYMATGGAVVYGTAVFLFSSTHSGMEYVLELENSTQDWLTSEFYGLWHLAEFVGALASIFFLTVFMMMWPLFSERYAEYYEEEDEPGEEDEGKNEEQAV